MEEIESKRDKEVSKEEKQFADLLFGDLEEFTLPVIDFV